MSYEATPRGAIEFGQRYDRIANRLVICAITKLARFTPECESCLMTLTSHTEFMNTDGCIHFRSFGAFLII